MAESPNRPQRFGVVAGVDDQGHDYVEIRDNLACSGVRLPPAEALRIAQSMINGVFALQNMQMQELTEKRKNRKILAVRN